MNILAFESSCDETSVAIVSDGRKVLSLEIASQIDIHKRYGGVVPEIASRAHIEAIHSLTSKALEDAKFTMNDIDAVAVTNIPGLIGALLVGVNFAKALAYSHSLPLITVNHIKGHVAANYLCSSDLEPPFMGMVMSGGHTSIIRVDSYTDYTTVARTRDDAVGEAFDKCARVLGIPYPGGKELDRLASLGNKEAIKFPVAKITDNADFSFSGLKTSVINYVHNNSQQGKDICKEDVAASLTEAVCKAVESKISFALDNYTNGSDKFVVGGGVCANSHLRKRIKALCEKRNLKLYLPEFIYCGDNAAMIGAQAYYEICKSPMSQDLTVNAYACNNF